MNYVALSKTVSHALRHEPAEYGLALDAEGWVSVDALLGALRPLRREWAALAPADLAAMIAASDKQRFEIDGNRIRAFYGHSIAERIEKTPEPPPAILFHGTEPVAAAAIRQHGLRSMGRQYVHLSADRTTAVQVGRRKDADPVVLVIDAGKAHAAGVLFYKGNGTVWLADAVPPEFIRAE